MALSQVAKEEPLNMLKIGGNRYPANKYSLLDNAPDLKDFGYSQEFVPATSLDKGKLIALRSIFWTSLQAPPKGSLVAY